MRWGTKRQPARRLALTVLSPCLVATGTIMSATAVGAAPPAATAPAATPQDDVVSLTNARRADAGCGPVAPQSELVAAAQGHADDMAAQGYFNHTGKDGSAPWDRARARGFTGNGVGENIAQGYPSAAAVVDGWMQSDGHRENIENCGWTSIGVGYHAESRTWVQVFGSGDEQAPPVSPPAPAPQPAPAPAPPAPDEPEPPAPEPDEPDEGDEPAAAAPATPVAGEPTYTG